MDYLAYKNACIEHLGGKDAPNARERFLFEKTRRYCRRITWIPCISMVAVANSLSMYATHEDSDIDLFIVARPHTLWFVRVMVTIVFFFSGVWRHKKDIRGNFCLSFFVTTQALALEKIAINDDIYLYFWVYFLKPVFIRGNVYERFLRENSWVQVSEEQKKENLRFAEIRSASRDSCIFVWETIDRLFIALFRARTLRNNAALGNPPGVIITDHMLKFHVEDRRMRIRDTLLREKKPEIPDVLTK